MGSIVIRNGYCTQEIRTAIANAKDRMHEEPNATDQQIRLGVEKNTTEMLHMEYHSVRIGHVLEEDGENQMDG